MSRKQWQSTEVLLSVTYRTAKTFVLGRGFEPLKVYHLTRLKILRPKPLVEPSRCIGYEARTRSLHSESVMPYQFGQPNICNVLKLKVGSLYLHSSTRIRCFVLTFRRPAALLNFFMLLFQTLLALVLSHQCATLHYVYIPSS